MKHWANRELQQGHQLFAGLPNHRAGTGAGRGRNYSNVPRPHRALGVIKSTAIWVQRLYMECVMYFNNDGAQRQTGSWSRSLPQLILCWPLWWGVSPAPLPGCHFSGKRRDEQADNHRETAAEGPACLFCHSLVCMCARIHTYRHTALIVIFLYAREISRACVVTSRHVCWCVSSPNVYSARGEYAPTTPCVQRRVFQHQLGLWAHPLSSGHNG